jgi:hypothetical protein
MPVEDLIAISRLQRLIGMTDLMVEDDAIAQPDRIAGVVAR